MMTEEDRLGDLSKLISRLRFAVEGEDRQMASEIEEEINLLAKHLPEDFSISNLIQAVMDSSLKGGQLAKLYIDRCYKLSSGDKAGALDLDVKIKALETVD
jgi:translation initiation factor 2B subunit (eIF-2B alpha/beta/delta family)